MHIAVAVAWQQDVAVGNLGTVNYLFPHILVNLFLNGQLACRGQRIYHIQAQTVLMAIHREDGNLSGIAGSLNTRNVVFLLHRHLQLSCLTTLNIIAPQRATGIHLACHRIFIGVASRVFGILLMLRFQTFKHRHAELLDLALIVTHPHQLLAIGSKHHSPAETELLFVHPVGNAVNHLVTPSVVGNLFFSVVLVQFHKENVIVAHKGYLLSVRREQRCLLRPTRRKRHYAVVLSRIYIIGGSMRTAINHFCLGSDEHATTVRTHLETVYILQFAPQNGCNVKERCRLFA